MAPIPRQRGVQPFSPTRRASRVAAALLLIMALAVLGSTVKAASALHSFPADESLARALGWPWPERGPPGSDAVFRVHVPRTAACFERCFARASRPQTGSPSHSDDDENVMNDSAWETIERGAAGEGLSDLRRVRHSFQDDVRAAEALLACEAKCGVLKQVDQSAFFRRASSPGSRILLLWESFAFSEAEHGRLALRELVRIAQAVQGSHVPVYLFTYTGWTPASEEVQSWWVAEHKLSLRQWQSHPASFGGWGRATLSLVEEGHIIWDVFDIVHSASHAGLLHALQGDQRQTLREQLSQFVNNGDLSGALRYIRLENQQETALLPFQLCLHVAHVVLEQSGQLDALFNEDKHGHLDILAELCESPQQAAHAELSAHRGDLDYERFAKMTWDMGLVLKGTSLWKHAEGIWRKVVALIGAQRAANDGGPARHVALLASLVPVFEDGLDEGFGSGERRKGILVSICFHNSSVPDIGIHERYHTRERRHRPQPDVNSDEFLLLLPCEQLLPDQVMRCLMAVIADLRAAALDLESQAPYHLGGLVLGVGFVDNPLYDSLKHLWSVEETTEDFPEKHITEDYAARKERRDSRRMASGDHHGEL